MGLVACCDMAVAADTAGFCLSEVKIGLIPATISPYVIRAMGARAAHRYFLTGERFSAQEAHRIGYVHEVVDADGLDAVVDGWLKHLLSAGPAAVRACKRLVLDMAEREISEQLIAATVESIATIRASSEGKEACRPFSTSANPTGCPDEMTNLASGRFSPGDRNEHHGYLANHHRLAAPHRPAYRPRNGQGRGRCCGQVGDVAARAGQAVGRWTWPRCLRWRRLWAGPAAFASMPWCLSWACWVPVV
jgi:hypothetical protein